MAKRIVKVKEFELEGVFESHWAAERWLTKNGYKYGSSCAGSPIAITKVEYNLPQKWKNMTTIERNSVDGILESGRTGKAKITLYEHF